MATININISVLQKSKVNQIFFSTFLKKGDHALSFTRVVTSYLSGDVGDFNVVITNMDKAVKIRWKLFKKNLIAFEDFTPFSFLSQL